MVEHRHQFKPGAMLLKSDAVHRMDVFAPSADKVLVSLSIKLERLLMDAEQLHYRAEKASEEFKWFVEHLPELMAGPEGVDLDV